MERLVVYLAPCIFFISCAPPQPEVQPPPDRGVFEMLALHVQSRMKLSYDCSAGGAVVMKDGKIVYEEYFGKTHRGYDAVPVTAESRFPFFSVSKGFGAAVLASLVSHGTLSLDDQVSKYLDYFTGAGTGGKYPREFVTVRHLASHSSGLPDDSTPPRTWDEEPLFHDVVLEFKPGESFLYTELAMRLLGYVMELASGKTYEQLLAERVVEPLGISSVDFVRQGESVENVVYTCVGLDSSHIAYSDEFAQKPYPGSGLYGSLPDIARYTQAWLDGGKAGDRELFTEDYIALAWQTQPPGREPDPDYGLLFWLFPQVDAVVFSGMAHTICAILPEENMILVMGLNQRKGNRGWSFQEEKVNLALIGHAILAQMPE